jgi:4-hydroxythreonine-4-phosphate dehydrogenase
MSLPLAVTLGEPAGIGPDLTLAIWTRRSELSLPPFYLIGDCNFLEARAKTLSLDVTLAESTPATAEAVFDRALPVVPLPAAVTAQPGKPDATSAPAAVGAIRTAVADVLAGRASAVVTNPIAKSVLYDAGFTHPGHTEFLAELAEQATGKRVRPVMMLWSPELAVVPVTIHIPLRAVMDTLTADLIVETGRIAARDTQTRLGIPKARLAVAGLNPHAGESGTIGNEDRDIVAPAVARLRAEGIEARGPLPADTMFHGAARESYDVALCMYHDQALIPIKTLAFDHGVNATLGLPFVRTSPDHGTAFDLAGTGRADPGSLVAALKLAARMARA